MQKKNEGIIFDFTKFQEERLKMKKPKINVMMSCYNTMPLVKAAFNSIIDFADEVILTEGAWNPEVKEKRSVDGTWEFCCDMESKYKSKVTFLSYDFTPETYMFYKCDAHKKFIKEAVNHPYFDGPTLQMLMLTRDLAMNHMILKAKEKNEDPGWYFLVDSDEVYDRQGLENLIEFLTLVQDDYDFFNIQAKVFYFDYKHYATEWYRRLFRIKPDAFFSDDNSLDTPKGGYPRSMNIPPEICQYFHYCYVGKKRVDKKLEIWNKDAVIRWKEKHDSLLTGETKYQGGGVHLFGETNPGYANYSLTKLEDYEHPVWMDDIISSESK